MIIPIIKINVFKFDLLQTLILTYLFFSINPNTIINAQNTVAKFYFSTSIDQ